ncbi:MAG: DUF4625 domain-containing protein [Odoribacteraceae bacterium]|jgi:hypothetical protein|nr:DUF4625 domain-containing protein [Odoribacteraceae bacterium]
MKTISCFNICLLAIFALLAAACGDDSDNTKPVINLIEPADGDTLHIGDDVHFEMELSDNEELKSYKVDIHDNFDGHTHALSRDTEPESVAFSFNKTWELTGKKTASVHHHEIVIPENATPGAYHLMVYCTDAAGNEALVARDVVLSHEGGEHDHGDDDHDE